MVFKGFHAIEDVWPVTTQFLTVMMSLPNFITADKHFASTFSIQKFKFLGPDCKLSLIFLPQPMHAA